MSETPYSAYQPTIPLETIHHGREVLPVVIPTEEEIASLPERPEINEMVHVLGTGIAGCVTAWFLTEAGYKVTLIEQHEKPFSGTSINALGIHLGGRYPRDQETARECLDSGIRMRQLMSFAFSNNKLRFLVADDSPVVDYPAYLKFYTEHREYYRSLPPDKQLFGDPDAFFRILGRDELKAFSNIAGGIETQEACFNMDRVRSTILRTLDARGATFLTSTKVHAIKRLIGESERYAMELEDLATGTWREVRTSILVNATGHSTRILGQELGEAPDTKMDLRFFMDIVPDEKTRKQYPHPFVIIPGYMHYVPLSPEATSLVGFQETIDTTFTPKGHYAELPAAWKRQLSTRTVHNMDVRAKSILESARSFMPLLGKVAIHDLRPGVAVSFNAEQHVKRQPTVEANPDLPGYYQLNPTKASHALSLAREVVKHVVEQSRKLGAMVDSPYTDDVLQGQRIAYLD